MLLWGIWSLFRLFDFPNKLIILLDLTLILVINWTHLYVFNRFIFYKSTLLFVCKCFLRQAQVLIVISLSCWCCFVFFDFKRAWRFLWCDKLLRELLNVFIYKVWRPFAVQLFKLECFRVKANTCHNCFTRARYYFRLGNHGIDLLLPHIGLCYSLFSWEL